MSQAPARSARIYLDHAATTPVLPEVREAMAPYLDARFGNPSSLHQEGREARDGLEAARESISRACGAGGFDLVFVSGGTEANHLALLGPLLAKASADRRPARRRLVVGAVEHPSLLSAEPLARELGGEWCVARATRDGTVDLDSLSAELGDTALLSSVQWANNETGAEQPVARAAEAAHRAGAWLHTDAAQALGKVPFDLDGSGADLATITAHKLGGPKGIAGLFVRKGLDLRPLLRGGAQEGGRRAGTESVALAAGFARAVASAQEVRVELMAELARARDGLLEAVAQRWPRAVVNTPSRERLPTIVNVSFPWVEGEALVRLLDWHGVAASTGSACSSGAHRPSHVLAAMGRSDREIRGSLRLSLGRGNSAADVAPVCDALQRALKQLESVAGATG